MDRSGCTAATVFLLAVLGCAEPGELERSAAGEPARASVDWALAIHGGAGVIDPELPDEDRRGYLASLERALVLS